MKKIQEAIDMLEAIQIDADFTTDVRVLALEAQLSLLKLKIRLS